MHRLFNARNDAGGALDNPEFQRVRAGLQHSIAQVVGYRQANTRSMHGSHLLVRLLMNLNISLGYELEFYIARVEAIALNKSIPLKMTSSYHRGEVFEGVFYSKFGHRGGLREVIVATTDSFDVRDMEINWRSYQPVKVLSHPLTDLNLTVPDGSVNIPGEGVAVITVNIPMLAAQYYLWRKERRHLDEQYSARTVEQFLMEVPLPNMLYSHVDIAVVNRMICLYFDMPVAVSRPRHPFALVPWDRTLDRVLRMWLDKLIPRRYDFDTMLHRMPVVSADSYHEIIRLPEQSYTRQIQWAMLLAYLPLIAFMVVQNERIHNPRNQHFLNRIRLYLRVTEYDRTLRQALNDSDYNNAMELINHGIRPYL